MIYEYSTETSTCLMFVWGVFVCFPENNILFHITQGPDHCQRNQKSTQTEALWGQDLGSVSFPAEKWRQNEDRKDP